MTTRTLGVISPHPPIIVRAVGGARADVTAATLKGLAAAARELEAFAPDTLALMSPHAPALSDAIAIDDAESFAGSLAQFGDASEQRWAGDPDLARAIVAELEGGGAPVVARRIDPRLRSGSLDHGSLVPLAYLDPTHRYRLVVISLSYLPYGAHRAIGEAVARASASVGRSVVFVASGDLSHRLTRDAPAGYSPRAPELDAAIVESVRAGRFESLADIDPDLIDAGGECGLRSIIALGGFLGPDPVPTRVLSYEGPWGVGYLTAVAGSSIEGAGGPGESTAPSGSKGGRAGEEESEIVSLARRAIETYVSSGRRLGSPRLASSDYPDRAGAFVSLHREDALRGCIGTILPTRDALAEEVAANAVEAATRDPRFPPVTPGELADLDVKVDVLRAPESCQLDDLDPKRFGVIVTSGSRRGLLLPDLEGVDDVETQVAIAMSKAGITPGEPCSLERFQVDRYT